MTKPVLLTVDDDQAVSRAVARDLRRRYGEDYRVVRADSGPAALVESKLPFAITHAPAHMLITDVRDVAYRTTE